MKQFILKSTLLSLSTAMLLGITGCSSGSSSGGTASVSAALSGIGIDGILKQANVCIDANSDGVCSVDENKTAVPTNDEGRFTFPAGSPVGPLILSGGTDASTGEPFKGVLKAPAGSEVVTPLTSAIQAIMDNNSSVSAEEAQATIKTAMGLDDLNVSLTSFDPYNGVEGDNSEAAKQILAKQTQLQILVHTAAATIAGAKAGTSIADTMSNVFDALVKSLDTGLEVELDENVVAIATRQAAAVTYEDDNKSIVAIGNAVDSGVISNAVTAANAAESVIANGDASNAIAALDGAINDVAKDGGSAETAATAADTAVANLANTSAEDLATVVADRKTEDLVAQVEAKTEATAELEKIEKQETLEASDTLTDEDAEDLILMYQNFANDAAQEASVSVSEIQLILDAGVVDVSTELTTAQDANISAHNTASTLDSYTETNTTYAKELKDEVLAQAAIASDALNDAELAQALEISAANIIQGQKDRITVMINNTSTISSEVSESLTQARTLNEGFVSDMSYINGVASLYSDASAKATLAQTANTTATDAYDALLVQSGIVKISGEELSTAYNDLNETTAQTAETKAKNAQIELNAQLVIMNAQKTVIQGLRIEVAAIEVANRGELKTGVDTLLAPSVVAGVADAKNMFAQIRETAVTFMDFDEPENNTSTIVGSQLDTIKTKIEPAAQAITTSFEESVTAIQNSTESFQTGFEADFNATMSAIETRMDSLMSQTESFPEDANWSVSANGDTLAHTYTNHGDGTVTDVFNLNSQPVTMTSEINDNGDKKPVTASGSIALSGTGYNLSVSEITLTSTGAKVVASGTISGDNDALMTLTTLNITTDVNSSVVDSFSMFQNIAAVLDGSIVVGGRTVAGTVNLTESKMLVTGNYTGLTTEPSFSGDVTLDTSFNSLINDAAKYGESDVGAWNPLLMVTFSDGNKSIVTSYTQTYLPSTSNSNLYEYNLTTQSGQNIIVETNSTYNNVYDEQYGYYRTISKTNSVTVSDGATLTPYYTNEDKISLLTGTNDIAVNNAWYNYDWNSNITSYRLEIDVRGDDSGNIVQNGTITQDGEEVIILDIVQTPNLNLLDRTFDARFNGTLTHGDKKIVASIGADRGLESKIYAQNIEITDGESFITLEELSVTVPNAELFTILEENNDDNHYNGKSQFENYTVNYDEYYDDSENDLDLKNILDAKLTNLQVSLFDTDNEILSLDANISFENRTTISSSFDGSYEYKSTKFNGHMDANGTYTDLANGDTEVVGIANVSGSVEANGFIPFDIVTTAAFTPNGGVEAYTMFTRNATYKLGMQLTRLNDAANATSTTVVKVGDSNGVLGELTTVHTYSTDDDTTPTMNVVDKDGNSLATYGEDVNGNNWEIRYNDPENSSETLF